MEIYSKRTEKDGSTRVRIFGITVKRRYFKKGYWVKKYLGGIYKNKRNDEKKIYYILGIKTKEKKFQKPVTGNPNTEAIISAMRKEIGLLRKDIQQRTQAAVTVAIQHQKVFPQFKNIHKSRDAAIIGTAPTLNYYTPIKDAIHIGVNSSFKRVYLDYFFSCDLNPIRDYLEEIQNMNIIKFFGQIYKSWPDFIYSPHNGHISNHYIESCKNAYKYYLEQANYNTINIDIETQMLPDLGSCVFQAAFFAIYTGVNRLYIVGCDCSTNGHWNGASATNGCIKILPNSWQIFKDYTRSFYPYVEIISINPVGLKGLFKDVYTESYVAEHPEIGRENIEIIDNELVGGVV